MGDKVPHNGGIPGGQGDLCTGPLRVQASPTAIVSIFEPPFLWSSPSLSLHIVTISAAKLTHLPRTAISVFGPPPLWPCPSLGLPHFGCLHLRASPAAVIFSAGFSTAVISIAKLAHLYFATCWGIPLWVTCINSIITFKYPSPFLKQPRFFSCYNKLIFNKKDFFYWGFTKFNMLFQMSFPIDYRCPDIVFLNCISPIDSDIKKFIFLLKQVVFQFFFFF